MPIPFTCPHCGHNTKVADEFSGRAGECFSCQKEIVIPGTVNDKTSPKKRMLRLTPACWSILIIIFCCGGTLYLGITGAHPEAEPMQCSNQIHNLAISLHNYHDTYRKFPPTAETIDVFDPEEQISSPEPIGLSWRVRLIPFLEAGLSFYEQFDFNEPWDSERNLTAAETMPSLFQCPSEEPGYKEVKGHKIPLTSYVMITGPGTLGSTDGRSLHMSDVTDGTSNTLMLVEVSGENRPAWTEPVDITLDSLMRGVNAEVGMSIGSLHRRGACSCRCDGSTQFLSEETTVEQLRRMAIIDDGLPVHWEN
jgi:hypothetical protein